MTLLVTFAAVWPGLFSACWAEESVVVEWLPVEESPEPESPDPECPERPEVCWEVEENCGWEEKSDCWEVEPNWSPVVVLSVVGTTG